MYVINSTSTSSTSTTTTSNKMRKIYTGKKTLSDALFKETGIVRRLVYFTSVPQMHRLLLTSKDMLAVVDDVFRNHRLPVICNMKRGAGLKMFKAMVRTTDARWLKWLIPSDVEELKLPSSMTDEEMLRMLMYSDKRFPKLTTLTLRKCTKLTDSSLSACGRGERVVFFFI